jgi:hypothetical protein
MKIILSRKGFDASCGGKPSPIFPDGSLYSLPIPEGRRGQQATCYDDIHLGEQTLGKLVQDLTNGAVRGDRRVHLDPDLRAESLTRSPDWRPLFGQTGAAEGHLRNRQVAPGDIFLFYGWFRAVEPMRGRYRYVPNAPDLHVLFGWLQIESRLAVDTESALPEWLRYHPHVHNRGTYSQNALYVSSPRLQVRSRPTPLTGAGIFPRFTPELQLTAPTASSRSLWELPRWFHPAGRASTLSYHGKPSRWQLGDRSVFLRNVGQGQEFVLDCEHYPEAVDWLAALLAQANPPVACA